MADVLMFGFVNHLRLHYYPDCDSFDSCDIIFVIAAGPGLLLQSKIQFKLWDNNTKIIMKE